MPNVRGIDLVNLRSILQKQPEKEQQLLARLDKEEKTVYLTTLITQWNPVEVQNAIYVHAGEVLFPDDVEKYITLGKATSEISYTGIYHFFLKFVAPKIVSQRWKKLWHLHHDTGLPSSVMKSAHHCQFVTEHYPTLPLVTRQMITGHISKVAELIRLKEVKIRHYEEPPEKWCWNLTWDG